MCENVFIAYTVTHRYKTPGIQRTDDIKQCRKEDDLSHPHKTRQHINFNVATLVHRSLSGNSASYWADDCRLVIDARQRRLRSTESRMCTVTRNHSTFGDRAFAAAGPGLWNSLPPHLRESAVPAVTKNIFVWIVGPQRSLNYFNCHLEIILLTYSLTYLEFRGQMTSRTGESKIILQTGTKNQAPNLQRFLGIFLSIS